MLWFVNPENPNKMINLMIIGSVNLKKSNIYLDNHTWVFDDDYTAKEVYEEIVKLCQQSRYRQKN